MANWIVSVHAGIYGMGIYAIMLPSSRFSVPQWRENTPEWGQCHRYRSVALRQPAFECTRTTTKNRSENQFVCADFCSDIKSLQLFLGAASDKKLVRVCWIGVTSSNNGTSRLLLSHNSSDKKSVRVRWLLVREKVRPIFSRSCLQQKISCLRWLSPRKNRTSTPTFSRSSLRQKNRSVCPVHKTMWRVNHCHHLELGLNLMASLGVTRHKILTH